LREGEEVHAFEDERRTTLSGTTAAQALERLVQYSLVVEEPERLFHLSGDQRISRYDFMLMVAEEYQLSTQCIIPTRQQELNLKPPRPTDVSLSNHLAKETLGFFPDSLEEQLAVEWQIMENEI
jgi:dTDP-4-dehydrorhamnose reductase